MSTINPQTPWLDKNAQWFQNRDTQGMLQGNITGSEQKVLGKEIRRYDNQITRDNQDGTVTPQERKQLWQEARGINRDIFSLRHNGLGSMGPGGPNAHQPHLLGPNHPTPQS